MVDECCLYSWKQNWNSIWNCQILSFLTRRPRSWGEIVWYTQARTANLSNHWHSFMSHLMLFQKICKSSDLWMEVDYAEKGRSLPSCVCRILSMVLWIPATLFRYSVLFILDIAAPVILPENWNSIRLHNNYRLFIFRVVITEKQCNLLFLPDIWRMHHLWQL